MQALNWLGAALGGSNKADAVSELAAGVARKMSAPVEAAAKPVKRARFALEEWISNGNEVVTFRLVESAEEWSRAAALASDGFKPEYCHQVFSDEEEVKGYKGLAVNIFINSRTFVAYAEVSYTEKQAKADDVDSMLTEAFGGELLMGEEGKAEFEAQLVASAGKVEVGAYGEEIARQALPRGGDDNAHLVLTRFNLASAPEWLRAVHRRMEPLLLFFIDGASGIDQNDSAWDVIMALRQSGPSLQVMGFCTLHGFFAYPASRRWQVSQLLVLEPFQRQGVAGAVMAAVMSAARESGAKDVTYEDPTPEVEALREAIDLRACLASHWVKAAAEEAVARVVGSEGAAGLELLLMPTAEVAARAQEELKLSSVWFKRVWESVVLPVAKASGEKAMAAVVGLMSVRIGGGEGASKVAEGKRTWDTQTGFVMARTKAAVGLPAVMDDGEQSAAERTEAIAAAVNERLEEIERILAKCA